MGKAYIGLVQDIPKKKGSRFPGSYRSAEQW